MKLVAITLGSLALCVTLSAADFVTEFKAANKLFQQRKYAAAETQFAKAAKVGNAAQKDKALLYRSLSFGKARKMNDALTAADAIKDAKLKAYAQMSAYFEANKWKDVVTKFGAEKIEEWPAEYAYLGHYMRGSSKCSCRDVNGGLPEIETAVKESGSDIWTKMLCCMQITSFVKTSDPKKALEYADMALSHKNYRGGYPYLISALTKIEILTQTKKFDEAQKAIDELGAGRKWTPKNNDYCSRLFIAQGDLEVAKGNTAKAAEFYKKIVDGDAKEYFVTLATKKLEKLGAK